MLQAFDTLMKETKDYVRAGYSAFAAVHNKPALEAESDISAARWAKAGDCCCILGCLGWLPLENIFTFLNCCYAGPARSGYGDDCCCCVKEISTAKVQERGSWSFWAPWGSVKSMAADWKHQNTVIDDAKPIAMRKV
jgi:hypothetical protein